MTYTKRDIELMINIFSLTFRFLKPEFAPEISLSALNYLYKNIEENFMTSKASDSLKITSD